MNDLSFEFLIAIIAFASTRYVLPKYALKRKIQMKELIILSISYGMCAYIRMYARKNFKNKGADNI
jgi:hypothetical protein